MNEVELAARLRAALDDSGRTAWELSRQANVKLQLVEDLLKGSASVPLGAVIRVADALEFEVELAPRPAPTRGVGPVETVVDKAIERLRQG